MNILYIGSAASYDSFNNIVQKSKIPPSQSAENFETALLNGLSQIPEINLDVNSFYSVASFPNSPFLTIKRHKDEIENCCINVLPMINFPVLKQISMFAETQKRIREWMKQNENNPSKCVILYGFYPATANAIIKSCKNKVKTFAIITDTPKAMYTYKKENNILKALAKKYYRKKGVDIQGEFDGYIYITAAMSQEVASGKPYSVLETICDEHIFDDISVKKSNTPSIMYAGALNRLFGIDHLINAFKKIEGNNCELWIFGSP